MNTTNEIGSKYTLLDLIGTGGMAEVYRAKLVGQRGFEKPLVIKQLLTEVAGDTEIVANFIDEARLAALLQHENIACVYDFGELDGHYFIAMEYLFGKNLHTVMAKAKSTSGSLEVSLALYVASKICAGMDYAHNLTDMQQKPLNIIHRDLTPHNVFFTYEGKVKIIDFGVAKAELFDNRTRAGVVKGKVTYMSPEQLVEGGVDRRSDIFSIGILLYEMLSGTRMYQGDTAALIRKCINVEYLPLEDIVPGLDPTVYAILHRALAKDKAKRYQSCGEMQDDISEYFIRQGLRPDDKIVKNLLQELFNADYEAEIQRFSSGGITLEQAIDNSLPGDDDKTVLVSNPSTNVNSILRKSGVFMNTVFVGAALTASVILVAYLNMALDNTGNKEVVSPKQPGSAPLSLLSPGPEKTSLVQVPPPQFPVQVVEVQKEIKDEDILSRAVEILLAKATEALGENRLTLPVDESAYTYYKKVQELDPGNREASNGLHSIALRYKAIAEKKLTEGNVDAAKEIIVKGLGVLPTSAGLLDLKRSIDEKEQKAIDVLLKKAGIAFAEQRFTSPENDCAYRYYKEIERIRPESPIASEGYMKIADNYARLGDEALQNMNLKKAEMYVVSGLAVAPQHQGLLELQADLKKSGPAIFIKGLERSFRPLFE
ncbi:serine/threonine-protein kinase [Desulforhopalus sp. IMCC35007]|uniref:serine/threonine-protein kinase n=1 Tax=Desulforhopalus sp. IMCC35007 TaxID=2569543 RepID=UPI0010AE7CE6|nr:serine/threonine-protein kinase [Desulforhopalus sp. IMCC35007]TKB07311.1 serine/threonine protein kinase [Desulforhopalus sp. IMCC35007]